MSETQNSTDDPLPEQAVTGTIENADVKWADEDEYDSHGVTVELLANGWIRIPMVNEPNQYYPPNEVVVVTPQKPPEETTQQTE